MKEVVVISGKGGTGKTTVAASFASLAEDPIIADCDVDAPDLWLVLKPEVQHQEPFVGGRLAHIDEARCGQCGRCREACHFAAVTAELKIDKIACEGCGACRLVCPNEAITMEEIPCGHWFRGETRYGPLVFAQLGAGQENSGKLVTFVRQRARELAQAHGAPLILIDGPPGTGCPVIASLGGAHLAVVVTEPTLSGWHDLERVLGVCRHFGVPAVVVVNKADLNPQVTEEIASYCRATVLEMIGQIPFDRAAVQSVVQAIPLVEYDEGPAAQAVRAIWERLQKRWL